MQNEIIMTGKTVEEALQRAYEALGVDSDNSNFEIIQFPKKTFFGLKSYPAKVQVTRIVEETPAPKAAPKANAPKVEFKKPTPRVDAARPVQRTEAPKPAQRVESAAPSQRVEPAKTPAPLRTPRPSKPREDRAAAYEPHPINIPGSAEFVPTPDEELHEKSRLAMGYLGDILREMGVKNAVIRARETKESIELMLEGEGLGVIIGRRGETLDAVQYLTALVANRIDNEYVRISIDSGDYRKKRAETLERLALKLAKNAVKTGRSQKLEPMNPYERRLIHAAVSHVEGASSSSIGEEPNRRVVISSQNAKPQAPRAAGTGTGTGTGNSRPPREGGFREGGSRDGGFREGGSRDGGRGPRTPRDGKPFSDSRRDGPRPDRRRDGQSTTPRPGSTAPAERIRDAEIEIPSDLAPGKVPPPQPVAPKTVGAPNTPSELEKGGALYGKLDI